MQVINPSPGAVYSGLSNAVMTIARVEGIRSLWRGVASVIVGAGTYSRLLEIWAILRGFTGPAHAVYFATYEAVKQGMGGNEGTAHHPFAAGKCFYLQFRSLIVYCSLIFSL